MRLTSASQDNSDLQYSGFRNNVPYLALLLIAHPVLRKVVSSLQSSSSTSSKRPDQAADQRLKQRVVFDNIFSLIFLAALHGSSIFKILAILYLNYNIAVVLPRKLVPSVTWAVNVFLLIANEKCEGYHWSWVFEHIAPNLKEFGHRLDAYGGLLPRWEIFFKCTILRLISFNMDYYWASDQQRAGSPIEVFMILL